MNMNSAKTNNINTELSDSNFSLMDNSFIAQFQGLSMLNENQFATQQQIQAQNTISSQNTQHLKQLVNQIIKHQQILLDSVFDGDSFPDDFPVLTPQKADDDDGYSQMMIDKLQADNNLYKISLQKSEVIIKNLKTENEYQQKQMSQLRVEIERQTKELLEQQQERFQMTSHRDQERIKNHLQSNQELKQILSQTEIKSIQTEQENKQIRLELEKLRDNFQKQQTELENYKSQTKILTTQNQQKLLKKIENITSKSQIQLNVYSNQALQLFHNKLYASAISSGDNSFASRDNKQDQALPGDIFNQQIAMAQLNDHILDEWKRNQREVSMSEQFMKEFKDLKIKHDELKKETSSLKIENKEINDQYDKIKAQFSQLLDRFQGFITQNEIHRCQVEQNHKADIQKYLDEISIIKIEVSQRDNQQMMTNTRLRELQEQILLLQNENLQLRSQMENNIMHSPINSMKDEKSMIKNISFNQHQVISNLEQSIIQDEYYGNLQRLVDQSDAIFKRLSQDYLPLQQYHESSVNNSIHNDSVQIGSSSQLFSRLQGNLNFINQLIDSICSSIQESVDLSEFKDISENIIQSYNEVCNEYQQIQITKPTKIQQAEDQNQNLNRLFQLQSQYFFDMNSLCQNILKCCLNKEIETSIVQRNMQYLMELINQKQAGEIMIDLHSLIKLNMDEILQLRLQNNDFNKQIEELQKQVSTFQNLSSSIKPYQTLNLQNSQQTQESYQINQNLNQKFHQASLEIKNCKNCLEMQQLFDELEVQITESKQKLEASTNVITKLESQIEDSSKTILQIVQLFEKKEINKDSYSQKLLQEYARDKVKRLLSKYDTVRKNNEEFQSIVIKELESLNLDLSMKRLKKKGIKELDHLHQQDSVNQQLSNMDKFKQLFTLLKGIIVERQQDREQSNEKIQTQQFQHLNQRKMSDATQASSQHMNSQTQTQLKHIINHAHSHLADRKASIVTQYENLSNLQTQRLQFDNQNTKNGDIDEIPVQIITERDKKSSKTYFYNARQQSSLATDNSDRNIQQTLISEKVQNSHTARMNTFGKEQSLNQNSSRFIHSQSNKENISNLQYSQTNQSIPKIIPNGAPQVILIDSEKPLPDSYYQHIMKSNENRSKSEEGTGHQRSKPQLKLVTTQDNPMIMRTFENRTQTTCNYVPCQSFNKYYENSARILQSGSSSNNHRTMMNHTVLLPSQYNQTNDSHSTYDSRPQKGGKNFNNKINQLKKLQLNTDPSTALEARLNSSSNIRKQIV